MLPSVSPLTSSPKKRLQFTGRTKIAQTSAAHVVTRAALRSTQTKQLPDSDEHSVDRVVDAERALDHVTVLVESHGKAKQRCLLRDLRGLDLRPNLGAAGRPVRTGAVDCARDDLRRHIARGTEELRASVELLERLDTLVRWVHRE